PLQPAAYPAAVRSPLRLGCRSGKKPERAISRARHDRRAALFDDRLQGQFEPAVFRRVLQKVASLSIGEDAQLPRRIVSVLWYIPLFMHWQVERIQEGGGDTAAYAKAISEMTNEIERLLGVP
ncbi:MAG: hypothetical protein HY907_10745, partial [Deltaproteobacteria bacterium]|nr:hypothetical protein [Deltaproteobacteria bacterium]